MKDKFLSGAASAVVYGKAGGDNSAIGATLRELGFAELAFAINAEELARILERNTPDLLFCDYDHTDEDIAAVLRALRAGTIGANPFLIIVASSWQADDEMVAAFRDAGVDGFLNAPVSPVLLGEFLSAQLRSRKKFVATTDYVGPDRRRDPARSGSECFDVVNSLKLRWGATDASEIGDRIRQDLTVSLTRLNAERQRQNVVQLCVLWRLLELRRPGTPDFVATLRKLSAVFADIEGRIGYTHSGVAQSYCQDLDEAIRGLERVQAGSGEKVRLEIYALLDRLGKAALALADLYVPGALAPSKLFELDELVATIDIRRCRTELSAVNLDARHIRPPTLPH